MTIPSSTVSSFPLPLRETDYLLKDQANELFGRELAESLKSKDGSWKKVMESWNISLTTWKIIKELENNFSTFPKRIYCETQANDGLIFKILKKVNNNKQEYNHAAIDAELITPYGFINLKFHNTESMNQFLARLEKKFFKQPLSCPIIYSEVYSFTLDRTMTATPKPCYNSDVCGSALEEEFGENHYSRTEALNVYKILSHYSDISIQG